MNDQDVAIDATEICGILLKALDGLAAGLIDTRAANKISKAVKCTNALLRARREGATGDQRGEFASILVELREADRVLTGLLARNPDATVAAEDLNASNDE
jgi:hypothetical protein